MPALRNTTRTHRGPVSCVGLKQSDLSKLGRLRLSESGAIPDRKQRIGVGANALGDIKFCSGHTPFAGLSCCTRAGGKQTAFAERRYRSELARP